jgi:hypothetical protein
VVVYLNKFVSLRTKFLVYVNAVPFVFFGICCIDCVISLHLLIKSYVFIFISVACCSFNYNSSTCWFHLNVGCVIWDVNFEKLYLLSLR